ncbi:thioredoxin-like domain-containing protein [Stieleria sp. TO1_6]|uniref:TlpA family protein disulfide reductase n=1 Tax=Stieleria tagensis TaxID=2956795 RepID=UPI00209B782C|nr:redoxin family protein [Stieleria tagensis]MCO8120511.1 thioredoxin-like domain-containing protein [Stieleria tagensis]
MSTHHTRNPLRCFLPTFLMLLAASIAGCGVKTVDQSHPVAAPDEPAVASPAGESTTATPQLPPAANVTDPAATPSIELPPMESKSGDNEDGSATPQSDQGGFELPDMKPADADQSSAEQTAAREIQLASWEDIQQQAQATGKITVVDVWSTSCAPCLKEFPGLVRLSKSMPQDVACISVNVDYDGRKTRPPESNRESVVQFLTAMKADLDNYLCTTPSDDVFSAIDIPSIPAVFVYDADGKLVKRFIDAGDTIGFTYDEHVVPFVKNLAGA